MDEIKCMAAFWSIIAVSVAAVLITFIIVYNQREAELNRLAIQRGMVQVRTEGGSIIWTLPQQPAQAPKVEKP